MHVLLVGNPVIGFRVVGPFGGSDEALEHAEDFIRLDNWWIVKVEEPEMRAGDGDIGDTDAE